MTRLSRNDWLKAGFEMLTNQGASGLTIENLTDKLDVTKGSFYHHFQNAEDYKIALLEFWEEQYTNRVVQLTEAGKEPKRIFDHFMGILATEDPSIEIILRSWASRDELVRSYMQRTDEERVAHATHWFEQMGKKSPLAEDLAQMLYALLIGCYSVFPPIKGVALIGMITRFLTATGVLKENK
jgi:AcrR family transcriptional regulator